MKKVFYIALFLIGLVSVSCEKQEIVTNSNAVQDIPAWESSGNRSSVIIDDNTGVDDPGPSGIVDPNNPSDGLKKP